MKNIDKWNYYSDLIKAREKAFVDSVVKEVPKAFYIVYPNGEMVTQEVTRVYYSNGNYFGFNKVPSKTQVEQVKQFAEMPQTFNPEQIYFGYKSTDGRSTSSGAIKIKDLPRQCTSKEEAENKAAEIKLKNETEAALIAAGTHFTCSYCRKVVIISQKVTHKIFGRDRKPVWNSWKNRWDNKAYVTEQYLDFCSGNCAGNEQMSREG